LTVDLVAYAGELSRTVLDYPWPLVAESSERPVWTGHGFRVGGVYRDILSYEAGESNWTDDLTTFHEDTAGSDHPIDRASRELALSGLAMTASATPLILEVGCSSGFMLVRARQRLPHARWIGSDFVRKPLEKLAADVPELPLLHFDLRACPLPDASVDAVLLLNVLEHIDDDARAMHHVHRILRPGGVAVIEVPAGPELYDVYDELLMHHRRYTAKGLRQLLRASGFEVARFSHLGTFIYPPFYAVKQWNKRHLSRARAEQRTIVAREIRSTRSNPVVRALLGLELKLGRYVSWPFGIRCAAVARKPAAAVASAAHTEPK
jgi:SAM-dependent methyltransferase